MKSGRSPWPFRRRAEVEPDTLTTVNRRYFAPLVLPVAGLMLTGCATSSQSAGVEASAAAVSPSASAKPSSISAVPLLAKATTTVLDQPLAYPTAAAQLSSSILTIPPGVSTGWHHHNAPMYAYVQSGSISVEYKDGPTKVYSAGQAIVEAIGTEHNGSNIGTVDAVLVVVNIGAEGVANTVKAP